MSQRPRDGNNRDRRMLASLRTNLGVVPGAPPKPRAPRSKHTTLDEALQSLEEALEHPSTSLYDFELYLRQNNSQFNIDDCEKIAALIKTYSMESGEYRFIVKVASDNISSLDMSTAIAKEFMVLANEYMENTDINNQAFPELIGNVLAWKWPPGKGKAIESVNPILYLALNVLMSWTNVMEWYFKNTPEEREQTAREKAEKEATEPAEPSDSFDISDSESEEEEEEEEPHFDKHMVELATMAVCSTCNVSQRNFWLNFLEQYDHVFVVTKNLLLSNAILTRNCKEQLLNLYMNLFKWSATGQAKCAMTSTQTA